MTNITHQLSRTRAFDHQTIATGPHIMSSVFDLEAQQVAQAAPRAGTFFLFLITAEVVTACKEEAEGAEKHEMDRLGPRTSSVASPLRSVSTGQEINDEAQSVVSQAEGVTSIYSRCVIPRRFFCFITGSGGKDAPEMNIDHSHRSEGVNDRQSQAEAHTRAYFLMIVELSMT